MTNPLAELGLKSPVVLAPMAGITDLPFRRLVQSFGAGLVVSEMVASGALTAGNTAAHTKAQLGLGDHETAVQLAGCEPGPMAEAARLVEANGARMIDINMGCPAKRVIRGWSGSALMRDLDHALRLIDAVVRSVSIPVTLKTRLGWDHDRLNAAELARRAEAAGIRMITIHGRTRQQFYKGTADWARIRAVRQAVSIPVLANGDIVDGASAREALRLSGATGVMVGRGAQGAPWRLARIAGALAGEAHHRDPDGRAIAEIAARHYDSMLDFYGVDLGVRVARKHLGWYMDTVETPTELRRQILRSDTPADVLGLLPAALDFDARAAA